MISFVYVVGEELLALFVLTDKEKPILICDEGKPKFKSGHLSTCNNMHRNRCVHQKQELQGVPVQQAGQGGSPLCGQGEQVQECLWRGASEAEKKQTLQHVNRFSGVQCQVSTCSMQAFLSLSKLLGLCSSFSFGVINVSAYSHLYTYGKGHRIHLYAHSAISP